MQECCPQKGLQRLGSTKCGFREGELGGGGGGDQVVGLMWVVQRTEEAGVKARLPARTRGQMERGAGADTAERGGWRGCDLGCRLVLDASG